MTKRLSLTGLAIGLLALLAALALPAAPARAAEDTDIEAKIASAKTPADHEAIADYYQRHADAAKAEEHTKMAREYKTGSFGAKTHFHEHCETLARLYRSEAKEYAALAEAHRQMAAKAKQERR
jgi:hypothetical protein